MISDVVMDVVPAATSTCASGIAVFGATGATGEAAAVPAMTSSMARPGRTTCMARMAMTSSMAGTTMASSTAAPDRIGFMGAGTRIVLLVDTETIGCPARPATIPYQEEQATTR